jgi:hypothetical protein
VDRDNRLVVIIAAALVAALAVPFLLWRVKESRRPILAEARIVMATAADPVFREGPRRVGPDEPVEIALAVRLERPGQEDLWLAPVADLVLEGTTVDHLESDGWPADDRWLRVNWFTVESAVVGGELSPDSAAERLRYRTFLAPEMGRGLSAAAAPEAHNDDFLGDEAEAVPLTGGTLRLHARAEVVARPTAATVEQAASTLGADQLGDPLFPAIHRATDLAGAVRPSAGELFLLPGFEADQEGDLDLDEILRTTLGLGVGELVEARLLCTSEALAALAVSDTSSLPEEALERVGEIEAEAPRFVRRGRALRWGETVRPGDLLRRGDHWLVLLSDDGDGTLGGGDRVLHSWRRPAAAVDLAAAVGDLPQTLEHLRLRPAGG